MLRKYRFSFTIINFFHLQKVGCLCFTATLSSNNRSAMPVAFVGYSVSMGTKATSYNFMGEQRRLQIINQTLTLHTTILFSNLLFLQN